VVWEDGSRKTPSYPIGGKMTELYDPKLETMPSEERAQYYNEKVRWVVEYAYINAPAMRDKMDKAGIKPSHIREVKDLHKVPITKKDDLTRLQKENPPFGGLLGVPLKDVKQMFVSPGPIYDAFGEEGYTRVVAALYGMGFRRGDMVINTFSYHLVPAGLLIHEALTILGVRVIPTGVGNTDLQLQIMKETGATGYVGTPSFLMTLIEKAEAQGYDIKEDFSLRTAFVGAEMLPQSMREIFQNKYGINVSEAYATADFGPLAFECTQKSGMHIPEGVLIEIVDPVTGKQLGPGKIGEVVVTSLEKTLPVIRFGTGDLSFYADEPCQCGRTSSRLVRIAGRIGDSVKVRGMFVHPDELNSAMGRLPYVTTFQAVVSRSGHRDSVTLKIELSRQEYDESSVSEEIFQCVSDACRIKFDRLEFVATGTIPEGAKLIVDERTWE